MTVALDVSSLSPLPSMGMPVWLAVVCAACAALCVAAVVAAVLAFRPSRRPAPPRGAHMTASDATRWHGRIDRVVARHEAGELTREEAFAELAALVREFASDATGSDMSAHTLADFSRMPRTDRNGGAVDLLRQTVAALYPPEFADELSNAQARSITVAQAAGWVSNLVDRWR
ncbi:hypothetical protein [Bifidobacterium avesanii]|uniref:Uncharacterized protein n=1 Tax=Bifidobacterium avesanii TaxID=1798157 RepID=A0A7K3TH97_9BIFI|nr:hypothetical protein [Bifidobacterium avesanii]KAB8295619.1 hypothetical protein DSM100685_0229 [Bifidobacterium avesanii]NEG77623.1 hypothetical protein [Bifidobacterium avesanii]